MVKSIVMAMLFGVAFGTGFALEQRSAEALPPPPSARNCPYCYAGACQRGSAGAESCTAYAGGGCTEYNSGTCKGT